MFDRKEQIIREQRTIEAMRKGLMGGNGKLCIIARVFGEAIFRQGSSNFEQTYLPDFDVLIDENEIPTLDEEEISHQIGWHFDGMRRGLHLEILWQDDFRELKTYYLGHLVYREVGGELDGYFPGEWEDKIEVLFEQAKKKERVVRKEQVQIVNVEARRKQQEFLDAMKLKWGI